MKEKTAGRRRFEAIEAIEAIAVWGLVLFVLLTLLLDLATPDHPFGLGIELRVSRWVTGSTGILLAISVLIARRGRSWLYLLSGVLAILYCFSLRSLAFNPASSDLQESLVVVVSTYTLSDIDNRPYCYVLSPFSLELQQPGNSLHLTYFRGVWPSVLPAPGPPFYPCK
jgi:hypothetical protein